MHRNAHLSASVRPAPGTGVDTEQMPVETELDSIPPAVFLVQSKHSKDGYIKAIVLQYFFACMSQLAPGPATQPHAHTRTVIVCHCLTPCQPIHRYMLPPRPNSYTVIF